MCFLLWVMTSYLAEKTKDVRFVKTLNHDSRNYLIGCVEVIGFTGDFPTLCLILPISLSVRIGYQVVSY